MITNSSIDTGLVLVPEINPTLSVQFGPHEDQVEMVWHGAKRIGGGRQIDAKEGLDANASDSPARGMIP